MLLQAAVSAVEDRLFHIGETVSDDIKGQIFTAVIGGSDANVLADAVEKGQGIIVQTQDFIVNERSPTNGEAEIDTITESQCTRRTSLWGDVDGLLLICVTDAGTLSHLLQISELRQQNDFFLRP